MTRTFNMAFLIGLICMMITSPTLATEAQEKSGHHGMKQHSDKTHGHAKKKKGHHFSPHWAKTLSDEQKIAVDRMHLELNSELAVLKIQAELVQKELNVYTIQDNAKAAKINSHIDRLLAVKKQIMQKRYAHLREMRAVLNTQQRISYDMALLKRSGAK